MTIKLTATDVQAIRDLSRAGFSTGSIARSFGVVPRTVQDVIYGRSWSFVADVPAPLPIIATDRAKLLRLPTRTRLTPEQLRQVDEYRKRLAAMIDNTAEREGLALALLTEWTPRRTRRPREVLHIA